MKLQDAHDIADIMYDEDRLVPAVRILRDADQSKSLTECVTMLRTAQRGRNKEEFIAELMVAFSEEKKELLENLLVQHRQLSERIYRLQEEILEEANQGANQ